MLTPIDKCQKTQCFGGQRGTIRQVVIMLWMISVYGLSSVQQTLIHTHCLFVASINLLLVLVVTFSQCSHLLLEVCERQNPYTEAPPFFIPPIFSLIKCIQFLPVIWELPHQGYNYKPGRAKSIMYFLQATLRHRPHRFELLARPHTFGHIVYEKKQRK